MVLERSSEEGYRLIADRVKVREHLNYKVKDSGTGKLEFNESRLRFIGKGNEIYIDIGQIKSLSKIRRNFNPRLWLRRCVIYFPLWFLLLVINILLRANIMPDSLQAWGFLIAVSAGMALFIGTMDQLANYYFDEWVKVSFTEPEPSREQGTLYFLNSLYDGGAGELYKKLVKVKSREASYDWPYDKKWLGDAITLGIIALMLFGFAILFVWMQFREPQLEIVWRILGWMMVAFWLWGLLLVFPKLYLVVKKRQGVKTLGNTKVDVTRRFKLILTIVSGLVLTAAIVFVHIGPGNMEKGRASTETLVVRIDPSSWIRETLKISPDRKRVAYVARMDDKQVVVVNGTRSVQYTSISNLIFSPDSKRMAYIARAANKQLVISDGIEGKQYDGIVGSSLTFSLDSKRLAYVAIFSDKQMVVINEIENEQYSEIGNLIFSPDSLRVAYRAREGNKHFVVVDGTEGKPYDGTGEDSLVFSPDSRQFAHAAILGDKQLVVVDGIDGRNYAGIERGSLIFSPDSKHVAYAVRVSNKMLVILDEKEGKKYDEIGRGSLIFSPDSKRLAYVARVGKKQFIVIDRW